MKGSSGPQSRPAGMPACPCRWRARRCGQSPGPRRGRLGRCRRPTATVLRWWRPRRPPGQGPSLLAMGSAPYPPMDHPIRAMRSVASPSPASSGRRSAGTMALVSMPDLPACQKKSPPSVGATARPLAATWRWTCTLVNGQSAARHSRARRPPEVGASRASLGGRSGPAATALSGRARTGQEQVPLCRSTPAGMPVQALQAASSGTARAPASTPRAPRVVAGRGRDPSWVITARWWLRGEPAPGG